MSGDKGAPLVLVEWEDSFGGSGWQQSREALDMKPAATVSVGWLVKEEKGYKVLAPHLGYGGSTDEGYTQTCGALVIPVSAIRRIVRLSDRGKPYRSPSRP